MMVQLHSNNNDKFKKYFHDTVIVRKEKFSKSRLRLLLSREHGLKLLKFTLKACE